MKKALLRLFNAVYTENKEEIPLSKEHLERTVKQGYIIHPFIIQLPETLDYIESIIGISGEKANASFHKSWSVVHDASMEQLVLQQIIHYITTYGFQKLGIYGDETIYIPDEILELPSIKESIALIVVKAMDSKEILAAIVELGSSGIALHDQTLKDIMSVTRAMDYTSSFLPEIKNRELKGLLYDHFNLCPSDPIEYLRYLISTLTDESLLIKNKYLIGKIKESNEKFLDHLILKAPADLASIFYRFKPLFLAMKTISRNKAFFNRLRKQANHFHKPLKPDYFNDITRQIKKSEINFAELETNLEKATIFRKIRLAYALKFRLHARKINPIVYKIRNGSGWATEFDWPSEYSRDTNHALVTVLKSIVESISRKVSGKTFYIPENVNYTLPATEKQFVGNLPNGSYVTVPEDLIVGIHWFNTDKRVDLDLSVTGLSGKVGWDSSYRTGERNVLFSGDITSAPKPNGASELFYLRKDISEPRIMTVNYYNHHKGDEVDCKILAAHEKIEKFGENYMVNVNNIVASVNIRIIKKQTVLGLLCNVGGCNRMYFSSAVIGNGITSRSNEQSDIIREYFLNSLINSIDLKTVLENAQGKVVTEKPEGKYVDLSPERLDKSTIVNLIS